MGRRDTVLSWNLVIRGRKIHSWFATQFAVFLPIFSLAPGKCACNLKLVIFKLISRMNITSISRICNLKLIIFELISRTSISNISCGTDLMWMPQTSLMIITMTSQWAWWRLRSPASRLFTQPFIRAQIRENIIAPRHWPLCGEFTGDRWILRTNGQ